MSPDADVTDAGTPRERRGAVRPLPLSLAVVVLVGAAAGGFLVGLPGSAGPGAAPGVVVSLSVTDDRLRFTHRGGIPLAVDDLRVRVVVDGTPLARQPPLPFFSAPGYVSGPTGPFNPAADGTWSPGETASLRVAGTNRPRLHPGDSVTVTLVYDGRRVARVGDSVSAGHPRVWRPPASARHRLRADDATDAVTRSEHRPGLATGPSRSPPPPTPRALVQSS